MRISLPGVLRLGGPAPSGPVAGEPSPELAAAQARITALTQQLADLSHILAIAQADLRRAATREDHLRTGMHDLRRERDQLRQALLHDGPHTSGDSLVNQLRDENTRLRRIAEHDRRNAVRLQDRLATAEGRP